MIQDAYFGALLLHPLLRSCNSIIDTVEMAEFIERGIKFIQNYMREFRAPSTEDGGSTGGQPLTSLLHSLAIVSSQVRMTRKSGRAKKVCLSSMFDNPAKVFQKPDEFGPYMAEPISAVTFSLLSQDENDE